MAIRNKHSTSSGMDFLANMLRFRQNQDQKAYQEQMMGQRGSEQAFREKELQARMADNEAQRQHAFEMEQQGRISTEQRLNLEHKLNLERDQIKNSYAISETNQSTAGKAGYTDVEDYNQTHLPLVKSGDRNKYQQSLYEATALQQPGAQGLFDDNLRFTLEGPGAENDLKRANATKALADATQQKARSMVPMEPGKFYLPMDQFPAIGGMQIGNPDMDTGIAPPIMINPATGRQIRAVLPTQAGAINQPSLMAQPDPSQPYELPPEEPPKKSLWEMLKSLTNNPQIF